MMINKQILFAAIMLISTVPVHGGEPLRFSAIGESVNTLISAEVVTEAYRRIGIDIKVEEYPAKRALLYSNEGRTDGELQRIGGIESEYPNLIPIPVPINKMEGMIHTKHLNFEVKGWESLKPYRIGIRRGIKYAEQGTRGMNPIVANSDNELFDILNNDIVELVIIAWTNVLMMRAEGEGDGIRTLEPPIESLPLYHYVHKKHQHLVSRLTKTLQEMENEGFIQGVRARFIAELESWQ